MTQERTASRPIGTVTLRIGSLNSGKSGPAGDEAVGPSLTIVELPYEDAMSTVASVSPVDRGNTRNQLRCETKRCYSTARELLQEIFLVFTRQALLNR